MLITRRALIQSALAVAGSSRIASAKSESLKIGVTDWNLNLGASTDAVPLAAKLGFQGVQVSFGRQIVDRKLPVDNPETIARYKLLSKQYSIPIDGTCVDRLHDGFKPGRDAIQRAHQLLEHLLRFGMYFQRPPSRLRQINHVNASLLRSAADHRQPAHRRARHRAHVRRRGDRVPRAESGTSEDPRR